MVRAQSSCRTANDLDIGSTVLAYNDTGSLSGFHCVAFFVDKLIREKKVVAASQKLFHSLTGTGGHAKSVKAVADGIADVCALDCCVWSNLRRTNPASLRSLRPLKDGLLGPHPVQPVVASKRLSPELCKRITAAFVSLTQHVLAEANMSHYTAITEDHYAAVRKQLNNSTSVKSMLAQIAASETSRATPDAVVTGDTEDHE